MTDRTSRCGPALPDADAPLLSPEPVAAARRQRRARSPGRRVVAAAGPPDRNSALRGGVESGAAASAAAGPAARVDLEPATGARADVPRGGFPVPWQWTNPDSGERLDSEQLITDNLKLARKYAWGWARKSQLAYDDLEAIAFVGLVKGCRKYNPASGYKLSTIAVPYINGEILHHFRDRGYAIKFPAKWREIMPRARRLLAAGQSPEEVCQAVALTPGELEEMLGAMAGTTELHEELVGAADAQLEADVLQPVQQLVQTIWGRLHRADRQALEQFWRLPGRRPVMPMQALGQFLTAARMALRGQRLPEVRRQLALQLVVAPAVLLTPLVDMPVADRSAPPRRRRNRRQLEAQAVQLGLLNQPL